MYKNNKDTEMRSVKMKIFTGIELNPRVERRREKKTETVTADSLRERDPRASDMSHEVLDK